MHLGTSPGAALTATFCSVLAVADEERQLVSAIVTFDHRGNLSSVPMARGRDVTPAGAFSRPFSFLIFETFKVIDGRIRQIEATVHSVP